MASSFGGSGRSSAMGKRGRAAGITGAALRAAQRVISEEDERASAIAQFVYEESVRWRASDGHPYLAPVAVSAKLLAPAVAEAAGVPASEENLADVASFLVARFWEEALSVSPEEVRQFVAEADARIAQRLGSETGLA